MPPSELIDVKPIREALSAHEDVGQASRIASEEVTKLERQRAAAVEADRMLCADAIEGRQGGPGTPNVEAFEEKRDAARRHAAARKLVADRAFEALTTALEEHQPEWQATAEARAAEARQAWNEALDVLEARHSELVKARVLAAFAGGWSRRFAMTTGGGGPVLVQRHHTAGARSLVGALRPFGVRSRRPRSTSPCAWSRTRRRPTRRGGRRPRALCSRRWLIGSP